MGFELLAAAKQLGAAGSALVDALGLGVGVFAGERSLGAGAAQHREFVRGELFAPLVVAELQLGSWCRHASTLLAMFAAPHQLVDVCEGRRLVIEFELGATGAAPVADFEHNQVRPRVLLPVSPHGFTLVTADATRRCQPTLG